MKTPDRLRLLWKMLRRLHQGQRIWLVWTEEGWEVL